MKKYIYTGGSALINLEGETVSVINNDNTNIDWFWFIEEAGVFSYPGGSFEVEKGDVILCLYAHYRANTKKGCSHVWNNANTVEEAAARRDFVKISSEDWAKNIRLNEEHEQNFRKSCSEPCEECDNVCDDCAEAA